MKVSRVLGGVGVALGAVAVRDLTQKRHALLRNYPVIAHARYWLETIGPELRQYIVTGNDEERPFSRDQRSWIYASSKQENNYSGFGTDNDVEHMPGYAIIKHRTFADSLPHDHAEKIGLPSAKVLGGPRGRAKAFRPESLINVSGMSFGSMSGNAIQALNKGAKLAGCMHNTGEGGLSQHHRQGGDIVLQIGTAYFGCRTDAGEFSLEKLKAVVDSAPVKAIEIKLSQGAKPGLGGLLPAAKVTKEISEIRGIPMGKDCASPSRHTAFTDVDSLLDFVELIADRDGGAGRHQERGRRDGVLVRAGPAHGEGRSWRRLRDGRRRRGRHGRLPADLRRLDRAAVPDGVLTGLRHVRRGGAHRRRHLHRVRQARPGRQRRRRVRARRRHGQRRARGDDVDRLHPVAEVPHRPMPHGRRDPGPVADAWPRPDAEVGALRAVHPYVPQGDREGLRVGRRRSPRPDHRRRRRHHVRRLRGPVAARRSTATRTAGASWAASSPTRSPS